MTLTLSIRNVERLDNGMPTEFVLHRRGGVIGRGATCDWCLPDLNNYISSRHCEVQYRGTQYVLVDVSTNGTYLNGSNARMPKEHRLGHGDLLQIGHYEVVAALTGKTATHAPSEQWPDFKVDEAKPAVAPAEPRTASTPAPAPPAAEPAYEAGEQIWSKVVADNAIDWSRSKYKPAQPAGAPSARLPSAPPSYSAPPAETFFTPGSSGEDQAAKRARPVATRSAEEQQLDEFLGALGLNRKDLPEASAGTLTMAAKLLRRLISGLMVMVQARAKAKAQLEVEATSFQYDDNNPLKFARTPEQTLARLLGPPHRGFLDPEQAIDDAFYDLQSHQMALLKAMQGALHATLARFSPSAIQQRAEKSGIMARIMPNARDAALWQNYQREFNGVAEGSDEAFMEVFAVEFRRVYEEQHRKPG